MGVVALGSAAFRHVVFPERAGGGPPVNFTRIDGTPSPSALCYPITVSEDLSLLRWLFQQGGLDFRDYKLETLRRRIPSCLRALRVNSLAEAKQAIGRNPSLSKVALTSLVIGVTGFFRDRHVFDTLATHVLPELTNRGSAARIWSAGCSDGAELYSIAMLLAEGNVLHRCYLLGTDCRSDVVKRASEGEFDAEAVKNVPTDLQARYFTKDGDRWRIHSWLRTVVQWRSANVLEVQEPGAWDMILCRNLAIYLRTAAAARLWQKLILGLRPGGVLVLGKAERPMPGDGLSVIGPCVYRRRRR